MSEVNFNPDVQIPQSVVDFALQGGDDIAKTEKTVVSLLSQTGITVKGAAPVAQGSKTENVPELDEPDYAIITEDDLESLLAYLNLDNEKEQIEELKKRIDSLKGLIKNRHDGRLKKINESLEKMDKAAKANRVSKIFGWLMTGLAVIGAVAACVATGGLAVGAVAGALIAVGMQTLNETGVMEKLTSGLADALEKAGCSKLAAKVLAAVIITAAAIAVSVGGGAAIGGIANKLIANAAKKAVEAGIRVGTNTILRNAASQVVNMTAQQLATSMKIGLMAMACVTVLNTLESSIANYESGKTQSELTLTQKVLAALQQALEENEKELEEIMQMLQDNYGNIVQMIEAKIQNTLEISNQTQMMG